MHCDASSYQNMLHFLLRTTGLELLSWDAQGEGYLVCLDCDTFPTGISSYEEFCTYTGGIVGSE